MKGADCLYNGSITTYQNNMLYILNLYNDTGQI